MELPDTYLGYCAGMYAPGATTTSSPDVAKADEARKQLQRALKALRAKTSFAGVGDVYIPQWTVRTTAASRGLRQLLPCSNAAKRVKAAA